MNWNWRAAREAGSSHSKLGDWAPFVEAVPYIAAVLLFLLLYLLSGTLSSAKGVMFDLPEANAVDRAHISLAALVMPTAKETLVFFDDARYVLEDEASMDSFANQLVNRVNTAETPTLLILADKHVASGDLMRLAALARQSGVKKFFFATKNEALEQEAE